MNELQLHRCIDGELNDSDRTVFLNSLELDNDAEKWRALALGYVENQIIRGALVDDAPALDSSPQPHRLPTQKKTFPAWSAITLCMGFLAGVLLIQSLSPSDSRGVVQVSEIKGEAGPRHASIKKVGANIAPVVAENRHQRQPTIDQHPIPSMHMEWNTNEDHPITLPVYSPEQYATANRLLQSKQFPKELQEELETQGYKVHRQPRIYRVPLDDGRQILVPTESVQVRYAVY